MQTAKPIPMQPHASGKYAEKETMQANKQNSNQGSDHPKGPTPVPSFAEVLLAFENEVRDIDEEKELLAHITNSSRNILSYRQAFVFKRNTANSSFRVKAVTSLAVIDKNAPFVRWVEGMVNRLNQEDSCNEAKVFSLPAYCDETDEETKKYPFPELCWIPMQDGEQTFGGILIARERNWNKAEVSLSNRITRLYAHAWRSLKGKSRTLRNSIFTKRNAIAAAIVLTLISLIPVHITALAPVEVMPAEPFVVAAPFSGVVKEILVDQNSFIDAGQSLVKFEDVHLRNEYEIADQNEAVAQARYLRASQSSFNDESAKHELLIAKSELELAKAEKEYAAELLDKSKLKAETTGLAIYTDKRDWVGRPVAAGEAILQLADPKNIQFEMDLAVKDSVVLKENAQVKVFLDSDPLNSIEAKLIHASYQARVDKRDIMSYRIVAEFQGDNDQLPRIGVQGTAQIQSDKAPLIYSILRRPLSSLRQFTGW